VSTYFPYDLRFGRSGAEYGQKTHFLGPPDPKTRVSPFWVAQGGQTQKAICSGMLADKKNAGPVALYPTVGVWRGRDAKRCKSYSAKTKNASESRTASKRPAIPLVSMVTTKKPASTMFWLSKMPKTDFRWLFGPQPQPKINCKGPIMPIYTHIYPCISFMYPYIPLYIHMYPHISIWTHIYPYIPIYTHIYPYLPPYIPIYTHIYPYLPPYVTHMYPIYTPYVPIYTPGGRAGGRANKLLRDTHTHFRNLWVLDIPIYGTIWDLFGIFGTIWDNLGPYGLFGDHLGPFLNYLGPFGTIWASNLYV